MDINKLTCWPERSQPVLVIEANSDHRLLIAYSIRVKMPRVRTAFVRSLSEALDYLQSSLPSNFPKVALLEISLPAKPGTSTNIKNGWQLLNTLRTQYPTLPVIILTRYQSPEIIQKAYELGVHSFVNKPSGLDDWEACFGILNDYWFNTIQLPPA